MGRLVTASSFWTSGGAWPQIHTTPTKAPVARSRSETNASTTRSEISAIRFFLDHCASTARMPMNSVKTSELRRLSIRPQEVNTHENRTAHDPRPGCLVWARKGGRGPLPGKYTAPTLQHRYPKI